MIGLLWGVPFVLLVYFCGSRVARFVYRKTGSRHWAIGSFFLGCTIPWADAWIGVPYFYYWQQSHPAGAIYKTVSVDGYLRDDENAGTGLTGVPRPDVAYAYVEARRNRLGIRDSTVRGNYVAASVLPAPNGECIESTEAVVDVLQDAQWPMSNVEYCLKLVGRVEPISRYTLTREEFSEQPLMRTIFGTGSLHRANEGFFRVYARQHKIVDRETGEVLAEAWSAKYVPWLSTWTGLPVFTQRARSLTPPPTLHPIATLIPNSPAQTGARTDATAHRQ
jgi:hypothetical protein